MAEAAFVYENEIATTPERLWEALTTGDLTRQYWLDRRIESDWQVGSPVRFYDGASDKVTDTGQVLEANPPHRLSYTFRYEETSSTGVGDRSERGPGDRPFTRVTFELTALEDDRVRLRLVHDQPEHPEDVQAWREGWAPILANLVGLLEKETSR
jgi:uncharacterized protein YndB with AHSA1/START domain